MPFPASAGNQPYSIESAMVFPYSVGVPGTGVALSIVGISGDPQVTDAEHRGNNSVIAKIHTLDSYDITATIPEWVLSPIASMCGGLVADSGTTPNQIRTMTHKSTDSPVPFGLKAQTNSKSVDGGATRLIFINCQPANLPNYSLADQEFNDLEITTSAIPDPSTSEIVKIEQYETKTVISSTW